MDGTNTLTDIARKAGLSYGTVWRYQHRVGTPLKRTIAKLANAPRPYQWDMEQISKSTNQQISASTNHQIIPSPLNN